jgi:type IV secretion system protein VirB1
MSALPIAAVPALAGACQSAVAPATIARIVQHESSPEPFAPHDNTTGRTYVPDIKPDAFRLAEGLTAAGHSVDSGLWHINTANFAWLGLTLVTAVDPCANIRASGAVLTAYSRYNTGTPTRGIENGYATAVQAMRVAEAATSFPAPKQAAEQDEAEIDERQAALSVETNEGDNLVSNQ